MVTCHIFIPPFLTLHCLLLVLVIAGIVDELTTIITTTTTTFSIGMILLPA